MTLAQPLLAPQRVALRTQHRSMAATPLVARANRQMRAARCVTRAAADTAKVHHMQPWPPGHSQKAKVKAGSDSPSDLRSRSMFIGCFKWVRSLFQVSGSSSGIP